MQQTRHHPNMMYTTLAGRLYVAWMRCDAISVTPLGALEAPAANKVQAGEQRPRRPVVRKVQGAARGILWGMRLGPDNALYVAVNPPFEATTYGELPPEPGLGFVARLELNSHGAAVAS